MRITESQLRQIIRQEVRRLSEGPYDVDSVYEGPPSEPCTLEQLVENMEVVPFAEQVHSPDEAFDLLKTDFTNCVISDTKLAGARIKGFRWAGGEELVEVMLGGLFSQLGWLTYRDLEQYLPGGRY